MRLFDPEVRDYVIPSAILLVGPPLGWRLRPDTTVTHRTEYFTVAYRINTDGYRDERRHPDDNGHPRMLLYGDSHVFGWGVPDSQRFSNLLRARHPGLNIRNLAVPGYGLDQQVVAYEGQVGTRDADIVVLFLTRGTLVRTEFAYLYGRYKPKFVLDSSGSVRLVPVPRLGVLWTSWRSKVFGGWYLPFFLDRKLGALQTRLLGSRFNELYSADSSVSPVKPLATALLRRAADLARARGHRLVLLTHLTDHERRPLDRFARERGLPLINLRWPKTEDWVLGSGDRHWNQRAHRLAAEQFWDQWSEAEVPAARSQ